MNPQGATPQVNNNAAEGSGESCWGDLYTTKQKNTFRIAYQNINGIINEAGLKFTSLHNHMVDFQIDIFGAVEANTNWKKTSNRNFSSRAPS